MRPTLQAIILLATVLATDMAAAQSRPLEWIEVAGTGFVTAESRRPWIPFGYNYITNNRGDQQRLIEEVWEGEWDTVVADFQEMADRQANLVRFHLQLGTYLSGRNAVNEAALDRLERLARLAQDKGIYLMLVGLGAYRASAEPAWYMALDERARWDAQARFWTAVARRMAPYSSVMAYDLMNEPLVVAGTERQQQWWTGEIDGLRFIQRLNLEGKGRTVREIARAWAARMIAAVRAVDRRHLITVGMLPVEGAAAMAGEVLDFTSPHLYPDAQQKSIPQAVDEAVKQAAAFAATGKPVLVGETYPLTINEAGFEYFVRAARAHAAGFLGHYYGRTEAEHDRSNFLQSVQLAALEQWIRLAPLLKAAAPPRVPLYRYAGPWDQRYDTRADALGFGYQREEFLGELLAVQDGTGTALCEGVEVATGRYALYAQCSLPEGAQFLRVVGWMPAGGVGTVAVFRYAGRSGELLTRTRDDLRYSLMGFSYRDGLGWLFSPP